MMTDVCMFAPLKR